MDASGQQSLLHDGFILLGFALVFVLVFRRLGLGATLGYLLAGAVVGPQVLGLVGDAEQKLGIAELGITLLLFLVGLELNPSRLWQLRREIFGFGLLQVVLCGLAIAAFVGNKMEPEAKESGCSRNPVERHGCLCTGCNFRNLHPIHC